MRECKWQSDLFPYMPEKIRLPLWDIDPLRAQSLEEIRLRIRRPVQLIGSDFEQMLPQILPDEALFGSLLENLSEHSAYIYERERREGFFTLPGGYRVGICGRRGAGEDMNCISGFNIRIAREWKGCADALMASLVTEAGSLQSTLLLSPPGVGKTTMLRDIARQFSEGGRAGVKKVAIADERSEIAGCRLGVPTLDVGARTDVMDAYPKAKAIPMLLRSMSPQLIVTDEIGGAEDTAALREAGRCGVIVIASAHAPNAAAARARSELAPLFEEKLFPCLIELYRENSTVRFRVAGA